MLFSDTYFTIHQNTKILYKNKGSKFLAFAFPAKDTDQITNCLNELKKLYPKGNHHY